jgi:hypothetical protein
MDGKLVPLDTTVGRVLSLFRVPCSAFSGQRPPAPITIRFPLTRACIFSIDGYIGAGGRKLLGRLMSGLAPTNLEA